MIYRIYTLDMWGHVPADCTEHGCPCVAEDGAHDDDHCDCHEECNAQYARGTIEVTDDASDSNILHQVALCGFDVSGCELIDWANGEVDINDQDGRRVLYLQAEES